MRVGALALTLLACAATRLWIIRNSPTISKDGTVYVKMAREWSKNPGAVVDGYNYHVGYPVLVNGVHGALTKLGLPDGIDGWELSGRIVSFTFSLVAMVGIWLVAGLTFNWRVAWITVLLFGTGTKWAALGSDVLTDAPAVCLQVWAVAIALVALKQFGARSRRVLVSAGAVGLCAGAGYLVRPESLLAAVLACLLWLGRQVRRKGSWRLTLCAMGVTAATALAAAAPYMIAIGKLTKKKDVTRIVPLGAVMTEGLPTGCPLALIQQAAPVGQEFPGFSTMQDVLKFPSQLSEAMHPAIAIAIGLWVMTWIGVRVFGVKLPAGVWLSPRPGGGFLMIAALAIVAPIMICLYRHVGYLSYRHVTFLAALIAPLAGAELVGMAQGAAEVTARIGWRSYPAGWWAVLVGGVLILLAVHTAQRPCEGKAYRQAGEYLGARITPQDWVLSSNALVLHYSQQEWIWTDDKWSDRKWIGYFPDIRGRYVDVRKRSADGFADLVRQRKPAPTYVVLGDSEVAEADEINARKRKSTLASLIRPPVFVEQKLFGGSGKDAETVRVYRINREALHSLPASRAADGTEQ